MSLGDLLGKAEAEVQKIEGEIKAEVAKIERSALDEIDAVVARVKALEIRLGLVHDASGQPVVPK